MRSLLKIALLTLFVAGCNSNDLVAGGTFDPDGGGGNTPQPWNPHDADGDGDVDETLPPDINPGPDDMDGDGIPDAEDNIPCQAFYIKLWNHNVSSSEVIF